MRSFSCTARSIQSEGGDEHAGRDNEEEGEGCTRSASDANNNDDRCLTRQQNVMCTVFIINSSLSSLSLSLSMSSSA